MTRLQIWTDIAANIAARIEETPTRFEHDPELVAHLVRDDQSRLEAAQQFIAFHSEN